MSSSLLSIGSSGLQAFQRSLNTIGHNIANVNTDGYSRQSVDLTARQPQATGFGFVGKGVETVTILRSYDAFIDSSIRSGMSATAEFSTFHTLASRLDNVLADTNFGMSGTIQRFFDSIQDVADDPASPVARQVMFSEGQQLSDRFNDLAQWVESMHKEVNLQLRDGVAEINRLTQGIAGLNEAIVLEQGRSGGQPPNDLLDQRDTMIRSLSEYVSVTTLPQDDGAINVMTGTGQVLVRANTANALQASTASSDPGMLDLYLTGSGGTATLITSQISGGKLGGVLNFRDNMLVPASDEIGRVAVVLGEKFNELHRSGVDMDGALGMDFFSAGNPQVLALAGAPPAVSVSFDDVTKLTGSEYQLQFSGGSWQLTDTRSGQAVTMSGAGTAINPFIADGIQIEVPAAPANGDTYLLRPTRSGALDMQMVLGSSRQIAAGAPVITAAGIANTGSATIGEVSVSDISNAAFQSVPGQLTPPILIEFTSATSYDIYDNSNPASPVLLESGIAYDPTTGGDVFPSPGGIDDGYRMRIQGAAQTGDRFTTEYNVSGVGDNRNALGLAGIKTAALLDNGTASVVDVYHALVADTGTFTRQAEQNTLAQQGLLDNAIASRESVSGVNLDEEAANLVRYQQAYQAAAQVISTANTLFDTILNAVRR